MPLRGCWAYLWSFIMSKPLGNLTDVSKELVNELIEVLNLVVVDDLKIRDAQRKVFNTLLALRSHSYDSDGRVVEIRLTWSGQDVLEVNPKLDADQVAGVLEMLKKSHDANIGITWETIEATIDTYLLMEKQKA